MSDFVSRVAARLVGDAVMAQPRLRGLFEADGPASALELIEEEAVLRSGRQAAASVLPTTEPAARPAAPSRPRTRGVGASFPASWPHRRSILGPRRRIRRTPARPRSRLRCPGPSLRPSRRRPCTRSPSRRRAHVAVIAVPASPVLPANAQAPETPAPAYEAAEQEELQPVRVHIGRLEVRATLEEQRRRTPRARGASARGALARATTCAAERETA